MSNLRYSARSFARTPVITVALVVTIAVGVGSNAVVHGFIRGLITRDLPVNTDRVYSVFDRDANGEAAPLSFEDLVWLRHHVSGFTWLGAAREVQANVELADREDVMSAAAVTAPVASLLGLSLGDGVVISHALWQDAFRGRANVRGERIRLDGRDTHVSGVAPAWLEGLFLGRDVDIWMRLDEAAFQGVDTTSRTLWVFGRLGDGRSVDRAVAAAQAGRAESGNIAMLPYTGVTPEVADGLTRAHGLVALAAGAVFLIACANVASFLLARATARSRETSVRVALGASRGQLLAQLVTDSVVIAGAGGAFGVLLAIWTSRIVPALLFASDASRLRFVPDRASVAVAALVCAAVTVASGLTPLLEIRHDRPAVVLRREAMGPSVLTSRLRAGLVVAEMAACCVLVISTGLLLRSFQSAVQTSAGRERSRSILATVQSAADGLDYFRHVEQTTRQVTKSSATAWVARVPGNRPIWRSFRAEPPAVPLRDVTMDVAAFTPETLERIVLPPVAGRLFGANDGPLGCRAALVNDAAADQVFGGDAVGASIIDPVGERVEIIGVVTPRTMVPSAERARPTIYYSPDQTRTPYGRTGPMAFRVPASRKLESVVLNSNIVSRSYFDGVGSSVIAGALFEERSPPRGCRVAVINREAADRYYGGNAVGGAVIDASGRRTEVIGVVSSPRLGRIERQAEPSIFFPMRQDFVARMTLMVSAGDPSDRLLDTLRQQLESVPGRADVPVLVERLDQHLARTALAPLHIAALLVRVSAVMALVLAVAGVYGALSEAAQRRRREIGVRIALGAQPWRVIALILGEGAQLAALGAVAGTLAALAVRQKLVVFAPAAGPLALEAWLAGPALLVVVVVIASVIPALRAVMVSPVTALKEDG